MKHYKHVITYAQKKGKPKTFEKILDFQLTPEQMDSLVDGIILSKNVYEVEPTILEKRQPKLF